MFPADRHRQMPTHVSSSGFPSPASASPGTADLMAETSAACLVRDSSALTVSISNRVIVTTAML
jgi:hypothetical protein